MKRSSAGAESNAPPQAKQPFVFLTTSLISSTERSTGHSDSTPSAVPAGEVTALEEVLGIVKPAAAIIGTTRIEVLSPGMPPMLCLSKIGVLPSERVLRVFTIALERASISSMLKPCIYKAVRNDDSSMLLR